MRVSLPGFMRPLLTAATLLRLVPITVVLLAGLFLSIQTHHLLTDHQDLVVHTHRVIEATKDLLIDLDDAETGQRGYLLSGDARYLAPYARALRRQDSMTADLQTLVRDNPDEIARVQQLTGLMDEKMGELGAALTARDAGGFQAGLSAVLASTDRATMDAIRRVIGRITHAEMALLAQRSTELQADEQRALVTAVLVGLASILTRIVVEWFLARRERMAPTRSRSA